MTCNYRTNNNYNTRIPTMTFLSIEQREPMIKSASESIERALHSLDYSPRPWMTGERSLGDARKASGPLRTRSSVPAENMTSSVLRGHHPDQFGLYHCEK